MIRKIGIDLGGVLRRHSSLEERARHEVVPPHEGALEFVKWAVQTFGRENIFVVSKIPEDKEGKTIAWLEGYGFLDEQGFDLSNVYFCRERADKAPIVQRLNIDYFIDDRAQVLEYMKGVVSRRVQLSIGVTVDVPEDEDIITVTSWLEVQKDIERHKG